ncbi:unnamed protein product [Ceratitis capitata]|uniref:(Mediterranean fruit fly) hypothetical protein n=1 Tax=Ceratitis capitata TaxID=7213 RepID=A0A811V0L5_CERCA|nr:unnamed protein product [Ceratitis capitata]
MHQHRYIKMHSTQCMYVCMSLSNDTHLSYLPQATILFPTEISGFLCFLLHTNFPLLPTTYNSLIRTPSFTAQHSLARSQSVNDSGSGSLKHFISHFYYCSMSLLCVLVNVF